MEINAYSRQILVKCEQKNKSIKNSNFIEKIDMTDIKTM